MRDAEALEMPVSRAMVRVDQCVAFSGVLWVVFSIKQALEIDSVRPGRGASFKRPSMPCSINRPRQSAAMRGATSSAIAICLFWSPSDASKTMRLRSTTRACVERPRDCRSNFRRTSSLKRGARLLCSLTHGEIAESIGVSRETANAWSGKAVCPT